MARMENFERLMGKLRNLMARGRRVSVLVGYTAKYAIYVHENVEMKLAGLPRPSGLGTYWSPEGAGPKFLERPARSLRAELGGLVANFMRAGATMLEALTVAGLRLQRESQ